MRSVLTLVLVIVCGFSITRDRGQQLKKIMSEYKIPGISLAYIQQGSIAEQITMGVFFNGGAPRVDGQTVFSAASLSKPVFAYAVMQVVSEGKLNLDTPLYRYYPYPDIDYDVRSKLITARMILSHTSGLPNWRRRGDSLRFQYDPGKQFRYSGEGYVYLGKVVEKITGQPIEEFMQIRVFRPLQMTRSSYIWQKPFEPNFALPHDKEGTVEENFFPTSANVAASLQTTAEDYAQFLIALMNHKNISEVVYKEMLQPQPAARMQKNGDALFWALGMAYQKTGDGIGYWQWGDNGSWKAFVMMYPETKDALVYFTNSSSGLDAAPAILKLYFKGPQPALDWLKEN